jgi:cephalosporin-C deacetylase
MPRFDLGLDELLTYRPSVRECADFDDFWAKTLTAARSAEGSASETSYAGLTPAFAITDVRFPGFGGEPVAAWLIRPRIAVDEVLPGVVNFIGYGGGRGLPYGRLEWPSAGYVTLVMDTRGQGSQWGAPGDTPDPHGSGPAVPGYLTRGIDSAETYYYRRLMTDAVRAVDYLASRPDVDANRIAVVGASQGGGLALAAGALSSAAAVLADVPFLCHFERAVGLTGREPYEEIARYLAVHRDRIDEVFDVLSYFDGVNMAKRISVPTRISVGIMDEICPPSTVYAAANQIRDVVVDLYQFNMHEGGEVEQWARQAAWLADVFGVGN